MATAKPKAPENRTRKQPGPSSASRAKTARTPRGNAPTKRAPTANDPPATRPRRSKDGGAPAPSHDRIAREAYLIWMAEGCPPGRELTHWLEAEQRLRAVS